MAPAENSVRSFIHSEAEGVLEKARHILEKPDGLQVLQDINSISYPSLASLMKYFDAEWDLNWSLATNNTGNNEIMPNSARWNTEWEVKGKLYALKYLEFLKNLKETDIDLAKHVIESSGVSLTSDFDLGAMGNSTIFESGIDLKRRFNLQTQGRLVPSLKPVSIGFWTSWDRKRSPSEGAFEVFLTDGNPRIVDLEGDALLQAESETEFQKVYVAGARGKVNYRVTNIDTKTGIKEGSYVEAAGASGNFTMISFQEGMIFNSIGLVIPDQK